jgi:hypothetical protein
LTRCNLYGNDYILDPLFLLKGSHSHEIKTRRVKAQYFATVRAGSGDRICSIDTPTQNFTIKILISTDSQVICMHIKGERHLSRILVLG